MKTKSTFLFIPLGICISLNTATSAQAVNVQDSLALVDLYNSTDGANWTNNDNWLQAPIATWYGITVTGTRVTDIDLRANSLKGPIPASLGNLEKLKNLYLGDEMNGTIPSSLGNLINLERLYLGSASLTGSIPSSLGNLAHLKELNLWGG